MLSERLRCRAVVMLSFIALGFVADASAQTAPSPAGSGNRDARDVLTWAPGRVGGPRHGRHTRPVSGNFEGMPARGAFEETPVPEPRPQDIRPGDGVLAPPAATPDGRPIPADKKLHRARPLPAPTVSRREQG